MSDIATIIEDLVIKAVVNEKLATPGKSKTGMALVVISVLLAGAGIVLGAVALDRYLQITYAPDIAALIAAGAAIVLSCLAGFVACRLLRQKGPSPDRVAQDFKNNIHAIVNDACDILDEPVKENPKLAVLLAAFAGFFMADHHLRS